MNADERLFAHLAQWLQHTPVVLASVRQTQGACPRKRGARMLIAADRCEFSIGGGAAEARVITHARRMLADGTPHHELAIDLSGGADAAGVCGGRMHLSLRHWRGEADRQRAREIAARLASGLEAALTPADLGHPGDRDLALPDDRLLIVGAGHCGLALRDLARHLDFDLWLFDPRPENLSAELQADTTCRSGDFEILAEALHSGRRVHAVLLNRDYRADVASLRVLARRPPAFLSMMGSRRRIATVLAALPEHRTALAHLTAPVGLDIGAQTPHEIAVSILAQVVRDRQTPPQ